MEKVLMRLFNMVKRNDVIFWCPKIFFFCVSEVWMSWKVTEKQLNHIEAVKQTIYEWLFMLENIICLHLIFGSFGWS